MMKKAIIAIFVVVLLNVVAHKVINCYFNSPKAYIHDGDNKVAYFIIPSSDGKGEVKILPGQSEYGKLCKSKYEVHKISPLQEIVDG